MRFLIDTDVVSQTSKLVPNAAVQRWWFQQSPLDLWLSAVVLQELRFGIELLLNDKRRRELETWLAGAVYPGFRGRILPIDEVVADMSGRLLASTKQAGHMAAAGDALIAATARVHGMQVATLNRTHFEQLGVELVEF